MEEKTDLSKFQVTVYSQPAQYKGVISILAHPDDVKELKEIFEKIKENKK
jgi:hypothetical protein